MPRMFSFEYLMKLNSVSYVFRLMASGGKVQKSEVAKLYLFASYLRPIYLPAENYFKWDLVWETDSNEMRLPLRYSSDGWSATVWTRRGISDFWLHRLIEAPASAPAETLQLPKPGRDLRRWDVESQDDSIKRWLMQPRMDNKTVVRFLWQIIADCRKLFCIELETLFFFTCGPAERLNSYLCVLLDPTTVNIAHVNVRIRGENKQKRPKNVYRFLTGSRAGRDFWVCFLLPAACGLSETISENFF